MDFFIPKKSTIGKISMAAMQKIPISRDFTNVQEANRIGAKAPPRPIRNFPAEKQSQTDKQADDKCRINKK